MPGQTSAVVYGWAGLHRDHEFPQDVSSALTSEGDAHYHRYRLAAGGSSATTSAFSSGGGGSGQKGPPRTAHVVHVCEPDLGARFGPAAAAAAAEGNEELAWLSPKQAAAARAKRGSANVLANGDADADILANATKELAKTYVSIYVYTYYTVHDT